MNVPWQIIAYFLYSEIALTILLLLPFISAEKWNKIFKLPSLNSRQVQVFFYAVLAVLFMFLIEAIRDVWEYDHTNALFESMEENHRRPILEKELRNSKKLYKAERNFYISGFSLFLIFVIRRLTVLIANQANLKATSEAALKQAESASKAANDLMSKKGVNKEQNARELEKELSQLKGELEKARKDRSLAIKDLETIKVQSEGTAREYDRLVEEHNQLQGKVAILEGGDSKSNKKDS